MWAWFDAMSQLVNTTVYWSLLPVTEGFRGASKSVHLVPCARYLTRRLSVLTASMDRFAFTSYGGGHRLRHAAH